MSAVEIEPGLNLNLADCSTAEQVTKESTELALAFLESEPDATVRELADAMHWPKSRAGRFLSKHREAGTDSGTSGTDSGTNNGTSGTTQRDNAGQKSIADEQKFDWTSDDSVSLRSQAATAIYFDISGDLVIRQQRSWDQDDDSFVIISSNNINDFLDELTDRCGVPRLP
jgi:hypothetical protein